MKTIKSIFFSYEMRIKIRKKTRQMLLQNKNVHQVYTPQNEKKETKEKISDKYTIYSYTIN